MSHTSGVAIVAGGTKRPTEGPCDRGQADFRRSRVCTREKPPEKNRILVKSTQKRAGSACAQAHSMASRGIVFVALLLRRAHEQRITRASAQRYLRPSVPLCNKFPTASVMLSQVLLASPFLRTGGSAAGFCVDLPSRCSMNTCGRWLPSLSRSQSRERPSTVRERPPSMAWRCDGVSGDDRGG